MDTVRLADTTLRDGPNSLWAQGMRTAMMVPIAHKLDEVGFDSLDLECKPSKKMLRELREDPWERIRSVASRVKNTPLRANGGSLNSFAVTPQALSKLYMELMAANGIQQVRMTEPANDVGRATNLVHLARSAGLEPIPNVTFSISPKHTDEYYAEKTLAIASTKPFRICLKDPGGLLTPERMQSLVPIVIENANGVDVELHSHCNTGLGPLNAIEGVRLGIRIVHVAVAPLANGTSLPSAANVAANLRAIGYNVEIDDSALAPITEHFTAVAKATKLPMGSPAEYDVRYYQHQIPGGMVSNLAHQLKQVGMEDRLDEVLEEVVTVRADLGYPILVTPFAQFVGTQAVMNVVANERYREVTDQVIQYCLGAWGQEASLDVDAQVRSIVVERPRARELADQMDHEPTIEELRDRLGNPKSDEELLIRAVLGKDTTVQLQRSTANSSAFGSQSSLLGVIGQLTERRGRNYISVRKGRLAVTLWRNDVPD